MTGKLLKWEWTKNVKLILVATLATIAVAAIGLLMMVPKQIVLSGFGLFLAMMAAIMLPFVLTYLLAWRYWKSMYGGEGYFTNTIPVRGHTLYLVKAGFATLVGLVGLVLGGGLLVLTIIVFAWSAGADGASMRQFLDVMWDYPALVIGIVVLMVVTVATQTYQIIGGISIGQGKGLVGLGAGGVFVSLAVLYVINQVITTVTMMFLPGGLYLSGPEMGQFTSKSMLQEMMESINSGAANSAGYETSLMGIWFVPFLVVMTVIVAWMACRSVDRHLSLR